MIRKDVVVLIVDDDRMSRVLLSHQLMSLGIRSEQASSGAEALALLERTTFDCILCDYRMPAMDGPALARTIREREALAAAAGNGVDPIYIVAVSANSDIEQAQECFNAGMNDVLAKPVEAPALRAVLDRRPATQSGRHGTTPADSVFDPSRLLRIYGRTARFNASLEQWIANAENGLRQMRRAVDMQDWNSVVKTAHRLHGSAAIAGAHRLASAAAELETADRSDPAEIIAGVARVAGEISRAVAGARTFLETQ